MVDREKQEIINSFKKKHFLNQKLAGRRIDANRIILNPEWTEATKEATTNVCLFFSHRKMEFYTEVPMVGFRRRADVVIPEINLVIEIQDSESEESIQEKKSYYHNRGIEFRRVKAHDSAHLIIEQLWDVIS